MGSKYDDYWRLKLDGIRKLLEEARNRGTSSEIDVNDIAGLGERESWYGTVVVWRSWAKSENAHTTSLGNILVKSGILNNFEKAFRLIVSRKLKLHAELFLPQTIEAPKAAETRLRETTVETALKTEDYGEFYRLIRNFEDEIRRFITERLGKGWMKRLEHDVPTVVQKWRERRDIDSKWGIDSEENLIYYADLTDYIQIIRRYRRIFSESDDELGDAITHIKIFAIKGRNPIMHCRTLTNEEYYSALGAEKFLRKWIERIREQYAGNSKQLNFQGLQKEQRV